MGLRGTFLMRAIADAYSSDKVASVRVASIEAVMKDKDGKPVKDDNDKPVYNPSLFVKVLGFPRKEGASYAYDAIKSISSGDLVVFDGEITPDENAFVGLVEKDGNTIVGYVNPNDQKLFPSDEDFDEALENKEVFQILQLQCIPYNVYKATKQESSSSGGGRTSARRRRSSSDDDDDDAGEKTGSSRRRSRDDDE